MKPSLFIVDSEISSKLYCLDGTSPASSIPEWSVVLTTRGHSKSAAFGGLGFGIQSNLKLGSLLTPDSYSLL